MYFYNLVTRIIVIWGDNINHKYNRGKISINKGDILKLSGLYGIRVIDKDTWESISEDRKGGISFVSVAPLDAIVNITTNINTFSFSIHEIRRKGELKLYSGRIKILRPPFADGEASISPKQVYVGQQRVKLKISYKVGKSGIRIGGAIRILYPCKCGDWGLGNIHVSTNNKSSFEIRNLGWTRIGELEDKGTFTAEEMKVYELQLKNGFLRNGDEVFIEDEAKKIQVFTSSHHPIRLLIDPRGDGIFLHMKSPLTIKIINGPVKRLRLDVPTIIERDEKHPIKVKVKGLDQYNNLVEDYIGNIKIYKRESKKRKIYISSFNILKKDKGYKTKVLDGKLISKTCIIHTHKQKIKNG